MMTTSKLGDDKNNSDNKKKEWVARLEHYVSLDSFESIPVSNLIEEAEPEWINEVLCKTDNKRRVLFHLLACKLNSAAFQALITKASVASVSEALSKVEEGHSYWTGLQVAARYQDSPAFQALITKASVASVSEALSVEVDDSSRSGLQMAAFYHDSPAFQALITKASVESVSEALSRVDRHGSTGLSMAAAYQDSAGFDALIAKCILEIKKMATASPRLSNMFDHAKKLTAEDKERFKRYLMIIRNPVGMFYADPDKVIKFFGFYESKTKNPKDWLTFVKSELENLYSKDPGSIRNLLLAMAASCHLAMHNGIDVRDQAKIYLSQVSGCSPVTPRGCNLVGDYLWTFKAYHPRKRINLKLQALNYYERAMTLKDEEICFNVQAKLQAIIDGDHPLSLKKEEALQESKQVESKDDAQALISKQDNLIKDSFEKARAILNTKLQVQGPDFAIHDILDEFATYNDITKQESEKTRYWFLFLIYPRADYKLGKEIFDDIKNKLVRYAYLEEDEEDEWVRAFSTTLKGHLSDSRLFNSRNEPIAGFLMKMQKELKKLKPSAPNHSPKSRSSMF